MEYFIKMMWTVKKKKKKINQEVTSSKLPNVKALLTCEDE